ncbi:MAG TPA: hypothetical protein VKA26_14860 [Ignavibacteriaceae bacterium]|nr:hypothetical protein [Ignavibacteriaceae bacterium]
MKESIFLLSLFTIIYYYGCGLGTDPGSEGTTYRRQLTVETNLDSLKIDNTYFDSTTIYPYVLFDLEDSGNGTIVFNIYPVQDTGFIKLNLYGGELKGNATPSISYKDSLTIYTPIDTTTIGVVEYKLVL